MKTTPRRDSFARTTNDRYSDTECPICKYGICREESERSDLPRKVRGGGKIWSAIYQRTPLPLN